MDESTWASLYALALQIGTLILVPVAGATGTVLVQKIKLNAQKIKGDIWEKTLMVVNTAVLSAEQQGKAGVLAVGNKKEHAMKIAEKMLKAKGIKVDKDVLSEMIEAQVWSSLSSNEVAKVPEIPPLKPDEKKPAVKTEKVEVESVG